MVVAVALLMGHYLLLPLFARESTRSFSSPLMLRDYFECLAVVTALSLFNYVAELLLFGDVKLHLSSVPVVVDTTLPINSAQCPVSATLMVAQFFPAHLSLSRT